MFELILIPVGAFLNRAAGSDLFGLLPRDKGFGRAIYYVAPILGVFVFLVSNWQTAVHVGLAFLLWRILPWGRWYDLGHKPDEYHRPNGYSRFEDFLHELSLENDHVAFTLRNTLSLIPAFFISPWFWLLPFAIPICYAIAWCIWPDNPIHRAEYMTGAVWGGAVFLTLA